MDDVVIFNIPAVARRFALADLDSRVGVLESSLAEARVHSSELARLLAETDERLISQRTVLNEELAKTQMESAEILSQLSAAQAGLAHKAATLDAELAKMRVEFAELSIVLNSSNIQSARRVAALETKLTRAGADLAQAMNQIASAQERLESLAEAQSQAVQEVESVAFRMGETEAKVEVFARSLEEARSTVQAEVNVVLNKLEEMQLAEADSRRTQHELRAAVRKLLAERQGEQRLKDAQDHPGLSEEISTCRRVASKCLFIVGFARSNTSITLSILNCAANALLLGEADFFLRHHGDAFSVWYNQQHRQFRNQITKSSHAPDFLSGPHSWWQWLDSAGQFYDVVGEKIALSDYHLSEAPPDTFLAFFEARFLTSQFVFMLRNPVDVLLSSAKLFRVADDTGMVRLCVAWLDYMEIWANFIRVFPRTMTIIVERFGEATVSDLANFTGLDLEQASLLINHANKRQHRLTRKFPTLLRLKGHLEALYEHAIAAADDNKVLWQAEQKLGSDSMETGEDDFDSFAKHQRPLGQVWLAVEKLRRELPPLLNEVASDS